MTPYASGKRWTLYAGDALAVMTSLDDGSIGAIVTDPPYCAGAVSEAGRSAAAGQGLRSDNIKKFGWFVGDNMGTAGLAFLLRSIAFEGLRLCGASGSMLAFCDWRMAPTLAPAIESSGWRYQNLVVWDKGSMGLGTGFRAQHEMVLHFTAGGPEYHNRSTGNVIRCPRVGADREHQTEKPIDLMRALVRVVSPVDGVVLDPFAGSGTTALVANRLGRRAVLIDLSADYLAQTMVRNQQAPIGLVG